LNILHTTSSYWSFNLLKYAMKCEPHGKLNLNAKNAKHLGFKMHKKIIKINFFIHHIKTCLTYRSNIICLDILIIHKSQAIKYIDSKPPLLHTKLIIK